MANLDSRELAAEVPAAGTTYLNRRATGAFDTRGAGRLNRIS